MEKYRRRSWRRRYRLTRARGYPLDDNPADDEHAAVMIDMQEAQLRPLLAQYKESCVRKFQNFGNVEPPEGAGKLKADSLLLIMHRETFTSCVNLRAIRWGHSSPGKAGTWHCS